MIRTIDFQAFKLHLNNLSG